MDDQGMIGLAHTPYFGLDSTAHMPQEESEQQPAPTSYGPDPPRTLPTQAVPPTVHPAASADTAPYTAETPSFSGIPAQPPPAQ